MPLKLSRAATLRPSAEAKVDAHYAALIAAEIGPLGPLHALKRAQAEADAGPLLADGEDVLAIRSRAAEQDARLAGLDRARRALKARIRAAATASEINQILMELTL